MTRGFPLKQVKAMVSAVNLGNQCERPCRKYSAFPVVQHQKVSGQGIDLSEGEEAGAPLPDNTGKMRQEARRQRARQGSWEGRAGRREEGGESGGKERAGEREGQRPARAEVGIGESA